MNKDCARLNNTAKHHARAFIVTETHYIIVDKNANLVPISKSDNYNTSYLGIYDHLIRLFREHIYNNSDQILPFHISTRAVVLQSVNVISDFHRRSWDIKKKTLSYVFLLSCSGSSRSSSSHPSCWDQNCSGTCSLSQRRLDIFRRACSVTSQNF